MISTTAECSESVDVDRGGAAFDVVHVGALVDDDQRPLELAHVLGVDPEVGLQRNVDLHALRHVDERAARPDARVQRRELVVGRRDDRAEVLLDDVLVLAQAAVHVEEDARPASRGPRGCCGRRPRSRTGRRRRRGTSSPPRGCPSLSKVFLMSSGTSSQDVRLCRSASRSSGCRRSRSGRRRRPRSARAREENVERAEPEIPHPVGLVLESAILSTTSCERPRPDLKK